MKTLKLIGLVILGYMIGNLVGNVALAGLGASGTVVTGVLRGAALLGSGLTGAALAFLIWRPRSETVPDVHGSARFGGEKEQRELASIDDGLIVGRSHRGVLMRYSGNSHLLTVAPTRSGKGVGAIIPNLLTLNRSVLCIDPKGENARVTSRARSDTGPVFVLDPFEISGVASSCFNPLAELRPDSVDLAEDVAAVADALVYDPPGQVGEAHWNEEAKALIAGLILHVVTTAGPKERNLATVRDLLTTTPQRFEQVLKTMQASLAANDLVARAANRHLSKSDREAAGVLSAAQRHTHFLDSPRMTKALGQSDFKLSDLQSELTTVFVVLPPDRLGTHARWLRLLVVQAINELARSNPERNVPRHSVLLLLDEFAALGRLEPIERAFGLMAGYGVQLWAILQDMHQLRSLYGERAGTFLSNAGVTQIFNVSDIDTATWVSRTLGAETQSFVTTGSTVSDAPGRWRANRSYSSNLNLTRRDLLTPDEVMRVSDDELLLLRPGALPLVARKVRYFSDPEFSGLFDE
jgi:type IV secretion system protein VirD4